MLKLKIEVANKEEAAEAVALLNTHYGLGAATPAKAAGAGAAPPKADPKPAPPKADPKPPVAALDYNKDVKPVALNVIAKFTQATFIDMLKEKFGVASAKEVPVEKYADFVEHFNAKLNSSDDAV